MHSIVNSMTKYLVIGSAPYISEWIDTHIEWFLENDYKIVTFNNSWRLFQHELHWIHEYHMSDNHESAGTFVMDHETRVKLGSRLVRHVHPDASEHEIQKLVGTNNVYYRVKRSKYGKNTMFFDILQYFVDLSTNQLTEVVFIGCDMMYRNHDDTFYNYVVGHKARPDIVLAYDNDFDRVALEFQDKFNQTDPSQLMFYNASEQETRLPFLRFRNHLPVENPCDTSSP